MREKGFFYSLNGGGKKDFHPPRLAALLTAPRKINPPRNRLVAVIYRS